MVPDDSAQLKSNKESDEKSTAETCIILVYNTDTSTLNMLEDYVHKIVRPSTYDCNLCALTYDNLGIMKREWKKFIRGLEIKVQFLHKDEFTKLFNIKNVDFPAAFLKKDTKIELLITHNKINECKTLGDLEKLVLKKVERIS